MTYIMVLNDGSTYTDLKGCRILRIAGVAMKALDEGWELPEVEIEFPNQVEEVTKF